MKINFPKDDIWRFTVKYPDGTKAVLDTDKALVGKVRWVNDSRLDWAVGLTYPHVSHRLLHQKCIIVDPWGQETRLL